MSIKSTKYLATIETLTISIYLLLGITGNVALLNIEFLEFCLKANLINIMTTVKCEETIIDKLLDESSSLYLNETGADIVFVAEKEKIPAHRRILRRKSTYFSNMKLDNPEDTVEIKLDPKVTISPFKLVLKYFYTEEFNCAEMDVTDVYSALSIAQTYEILSLVDRITAYLIESLSIDSLTIALNYDKTHLMKLTKATFNFFEKNAMEFVNAEHFAHLSEDALVSLLWLDDFPAQEHDIFKAILKWQRHNPDSNIRKILSLIRFSLLKPKDWLHALASGIFNDNELLEMVNADFKSINSRGLLPEVNIASAEFGTEYIEGEFVNKNLTAESFVLQSTNFAIKIQLGRAYFVNKIEFNPISETLFGYFIKVSLDNKAWERIIDYSAYNCHSKQFAYFEGKFVKFIKIVGIPVANQVKLKFGVSNLIVKYTEKVPRIVNGFVAPTENMFYSSKVKIGGQLQSPLQESFVLNNNSRYMDIEFSQPFWIGSFTFGCSPINLCSITEIKSGKQIVKQSDWSDSLDKEHFEMEEMPIMGFKISFNSSGSVTLKNLECPFNA